MGVDIHSVATNTDGWKDECRRHAAKDCEFWLLNVKKQHLAFCRGLCREYDYEFKLRDGNGMAVFRPVRRK